MPITPDGIFQWAVVDSRGGSYCFGLNTLLLKGLKGLGFLYVYTLPRRPYADVFAVRMAGEAILSRGSILSKISRRVGIW